MNHGLIALAIVGSAIAMNVKLTVLAFSGLVLILILANLFIFKWKKK